MISPRSFVTHTTERLIARVYSLACALSGFETLVNAWSQRESLTAFSLIAVSIFVFSLTAMVVQAFRTGDSRFWFRVHAVVGIFLLVTWFMQPAKPWPHSLHPWIWWALGNAAISANIGFQGWLGLVLELLIPGGWVLLATSEIGGRENIDSTLADSAFVLFLAATISAIIWALRTRAKLVDSLHLRTATAIAEKNRVDALQKERTSAAALVHTKVVTALELAAEAETDAQRNIAASAAKDAERAIEDRLRMTDLRQPDGTLAAWSENLRQVVTAIYPQVRVESLSTEGLFIPNEVALALTESVMQAVDNSVRHAGPKADTRLKIEGLHAGLKVVVADNGRGFRLSNAGRGQVGVHRSIIERSRSVGVRPSVDTQPGEGCRVVLQWVKA
jgi:signal transduction histidine kinase